MDQFRVAIVNAGSPLAVLSCTPAYRIAFGRGSPRRPLDRFLALIWMVGGLLLAVAPISIPFLRTKAVPVVSGLPGAGDNSCAGMVSFDRTKNTSGGYSLYTTTVALDMLRFADSYGYNYSLSTPTAIGLNHPKDRVVISAECPAWAPVCSRANGLTVEVDYWITPSDLGIATDDSSEELEFGVLNTCYKVESHTKFLGNDSNGLELYGLMYGGLGAGPYPNATEAVRPESEKLGYGYTLDPFSQTKELFDGRQIGWTPNNTLLHDGDLTLLIYHLGNVASYEPITDPLFETSTPIKTGRLTTYESLKMTVPIMCNTTFSVCHSSSEPCLPFNGTVALSSYAEGMPKSKEVASGFLQLMGSETVIPLMGINAGTSESVLASHGLSLKTFQEMPNQISGHSEIMRLALAGRSKLVTSAERAASGWVKYIPTGAQGLIVVRNDAYRGMCRATHLDDPTKITTCAYRLLAMLIVGAVLILSTFAGPILRYLFWKQLCIFTICWRMRTAAQLHRCAMEGIDEYQVWPEGCIDKWPTGEGMVDMVGLVYRKQKLHAVYGRDAELRYAPRKLIKGS